MEIIFSIVFFVVVVIAFSKSKSSSQTGSGKSTTDTSPHFMKPQYMDRFARRLGRNLARRGRW